MVSPRLVARPIADLPVLAEDDCRRIQARLEELRPWWLVRRRGFATVGVAAYLDAARSTAPQRTYYDRLAAQNRLLRDNFGDTLDRVAGVLAELLAEPTRFAPEVALPGFHIFEGPGIATSVGPAPHFDLQHRALRWPAAPAERDLISFTLAVRLPAEGGGLEYWDITEPELRRLGRRRRQVSTATVGRLCAAHRHEYRVGRMAVQRSLLLHRIAAVRACHAGDQRITMQGHGLRDRSGWILYW